MSVSDRKRASGAHHIIGKILLPVIFFHGIIIFHLFLIKMIFQFNALSDSLSLVFISFNVAKITKIPALIVPFSTVFLRQLNLYLFFFFPISFYSSVKHLMVIRQLDSTPFNLKTCRELHHPTHTHMHTHTDTDTHTHKHTRAQTHTHAHIKC
jgi:hypothetical protein